MPLKSCISPSAKKPAPTGVKRSSSPSPTSPAIAIMRSSEGVITW
jgi:hypothetical protein